MLLELFSKLVFKENVGVITKLSKNNWIFNSRLTIYCITIMSHDADLVYYLVFR